MKWHVSAKMRDSFCNSGVGSFAVAANLSIESLRAVPAAKAVFTCVESALVFVLAALSTVNQVHLIWKALAWSDSLLVDTPDACAETFRFEGTPTSPHQPGADPMCQHCVIDQVKKRMLDRRSLLWGAAAAAASVPAVSAQAQTQTVAVSAAAARDLTHELHPDFPTYFGDPQLKMVPKFTYKDSKFNLNEWVINEHTGTHMDAPLHFSPDGKSVSEVAVENLIVPLAVIDIREKASSSADAQVTPDDIKAWIAKNGPIPDKACIAMSSGWDAHVAGSKFRNADEKKVMHFPGFHIEAARMLLESTTVSGIAVDTLSLDFGPSPDFATHYAWLPSGRWGLEAVANLGQLPAKGATLVVGAPKVRGATGGPCRVFAFV
jgi:kynurenine formamidase